MRKFDRQPELLLRRRFRRFRFSRLDLIVENNFFVVIAVFLRRIAIVNQRFAPLQIGIAQERITIDSAGFVQHFFCIEQIRTQVHAFKCREAQADVAIANKIGGRR